jgi:hypothetical protein
LMCDEDNQYDLSEDRAKAWVEQLKGEGFFWARDNFRLGLFTNHYWFWLSAYHPSTMRFIG